LRKKSGITRAVAESMLRPFFVDGRPPALAPGREPHRYQRDRHHGYETPAAGRYVLCLFRGGQGHHHRQQNRCSHRTGRCQYAAAPVLFGDSDRHADPGLWTECGQPAAIYRGEETG